MSPGAEPTHDPEHGAAWSPPLSLPLPIETERLTLRVYTLADVEPFHRAIRDNRDDHLLPWMAWAREKHASPAGTAAYIARQMLVAEGRASLVEHGIGLGMFLRDTGEFVGGTGIHDVREKIACCSTGYFVLSKHTGKGYATEAVARVISWALAAQWPADGLPAGVLQAGLGLRKVKIFCSDQNMPSRRVIEKLRIKQEVELRGEDFVSGLGITTKLGWGVFADEWDCDRHQSRAAADDA